MSCGCLPIDGIGRPVPCPHDLHPVRAANKTFSAIYDPVYVHHRRFAQVDGDDDEDQGDGGIGNVEEEENATKSHETVGRAQGARNTGTNAAGGGGKRLRRAVHKRCVSYHPQRVMMFRPAACDPDKLLSTTCICLQKYCVGFRF